MAVLNAPAAPLSPSLPQAAGPSCSLQRSGSLWQLGIEAQELTTAIRQLPRPLLEALSQGFRKRFSIPEEAPTIADRILQKQHRDWIEAFLAQHQAAA